MKERGFGLLNKEIKRTVEIIINRNKNIFVDNYKKHISIDLIMVIIKTELTSELYEVYKNYDKTNDLGSHHLMNASYHAVVILYESWLEKGCKVRGNGHHIAQSFSEKFIKEFKYDRKKEIVISYLQK